MNYWLRNVRLCSGEMQDVLIQQGRIAKYRATSGAPLQEGEREAGGQLLLPPLVESHCHLDKTLWGQPWRPNSAGPTLQDYIDNERRVLREVKAPIEQRASALLEQCIARGSLTFRCHVDVAPEIGLRHVKAMLNLRQRYADWVDIQLVAFPQSGLIRCPGTLELMREALQLGVDVVGGLDPCGIDNDPISQLDAIFTLAAEFDRALDIHLHDKGELGLWQIERIADYTQRYQRQGRVMISHAYCLGMADWLCVQPLAQRLADLSISLMSSAPADCPVPPFLSLQQVGVNLCLGSDGIRDAWTPLGTGDMLERAMLLAFRFDLAKDEALAACFAAATANGARALNRPLNPLKVGDPADFLLIEAQTLGEAIALRPARQVFKAGQLIAESGQVLQSRL